MMTLKLRLMLIAAAAVMLASCAGNDGSGTVLSAADTSAAIPASADVTTVTDASSATAAATAPAEEKLPLTIDSAAVTFDREDSTYAYTGEPIAPQFTVKADGRELVQDTDFTAEFSDNTEIGSAHLRLTGTGEYSGSTEAVFTISPRPITESDVTLGALTYEYTGAPILPQVTVRAGEKVLAADTDYSAAFQNNTAVGEKTAAVTVTGKGNYSGTVTLTFSITKKNISGGTIQLPYIVYTYEGKPVEPPVTFVLDGRRLVKDSDFTVEYSNNNAVGTGTVTVSGTGSYTGTKKINIVLKAPYVPPAPQKVDAMGYHIGDDGQLTPAAADFKKRLEAFVGSVTAGKESREDKLRACFDAIAKTFAYSKNYVYKGEAGWEMTCADAMLKNRGGICYSYASLFAFCARYLGYDIKCCHNNIRTVSGRATNHCWTQLVIDGTTYICDPEGYWEVLAGRISRSYRCDFYMLTFDKVPYPMSYYP